MTTKYLLIYYDGNEYKGRVIAPDGPFGLSDIKDSIGDDIEDIIVLIEIPINVEEVFLTPAGEIDRYVIVTLHDTGEPICQKLRLTA